MSGTIATIGHLPGRRILAGSFALLGVGVAISAPDRAESHAFSYTLVDDGVGTIGYRVKTASGIVKYLMSDPTSVPMAAIKLDNATGHVVSVMAVNDTASSLGAPGANEFDVVVRTLAGAFVQTAGLQVSWLLVLKDRG